MYDPDNAVWHTLRVGQLPLQEVAKIGLNLEAGEVIFYAHAMKHTFEKQPWRRPICWPYLQLAVANPTHVGQQPKPAGTGFDLGYKLDDGQVVLVCISLTPAKKGVGVTYPVTSSYPLD